ncbi:23S rRNA (pseudouridine(1915)-N(3))-methyltransferase RlmH [Desulfothermus okinawensis JCM 13304]
MARRIKLIFIGKMKQSFWKKAEELYLERIRNFFKVDLVLIKDSKKGSIGDRIKLESKEILKRLSPSDFLILLDERGKLLNSMDFAKKLTVWIDFPSKIPCFVVGGSYGLSDEIRKRSDFLLSLSPLTYTHEMARVILLEQIYRAYQIFINSSYHH